ncbi:MAG: hypothetical protein ACXABY_36465 [Candidatus Thorarchaeota archaeon]
MPSSYVLTTNWREWIFGGICFALMIFHILPLVLPLIIPTDDESPFEDLRPLTVAAFFWAYFAYRTLTTIGKITFSKEPSDIHVTYGTIFRPHHLVMPNEQVTLAAYIFKGDKPDVKIRYGNVVLSLVKTDKPDSELILAAVRGEEKVRPILNGLSGHLNLEVSKDILDSVAQEPCPSLMDTEQRNHS